MLVVCFFFVFCTSNMEIEERGQFLWYWSAFWLQLFLDSPNPAFAVWSQEKNVWFAFLGKNPSPINLCRFTYKRLSHSASITMASLVCDSQVSVVSRNHGSLQVFSQVGFASFASELKGKICSLLPDTFLRCDLHTGEKCDKYQYLHFKHDFRMSVLVHSYAVWLLHAFSSLFFDCTSIWVSLA